MTHRGWLLALALVTWAGCFNSLDFETIECQPEQPKCPAHYACVARDGKYFCHKGATDAAAADAGDARIDQAAFSDGRLDGSTDLGGESREAGSGTDGADALSLEVGQNLLDAGVDTPVESVDSGPDTPLGTGGISGTDGPVPDGPVPDSPLGTGGAGGTGGSTPRGGSGGSGDAGIDAPASGGWGGGGTSGTGGLTGAGAVAGSLGSGGAAGSGGTTETGGSASTSTGGMGSGGMGSGGMGSGGTGGTGGTGGSTGSTAGATVSLDHTRQTITGFGFSTMWKSTPPPWDTLLTTDGLGLSIVRVGMLSDGSLTGAIPPASYGAKVIGTPLTAPAECKTNNDVAKGGHLCSPSNGEGSLCTAAAIGGCYASWATAIADFASNHNLYAISAGNEPDFASCGALLGPPCTTDYETMVFSANEMVAFVKELKPKLRDVNVKLISPETAEWIHLWSNTSATGSLVAAHPNSSDPLNCQCFGNSPTLPTDCAAHCQTGNGYDYGHWLAKDSGAWGAIDILGTHQYDTQKAEPWPSDVSGGKRDKEIWVTEMSGIKYWLEAGPTSGISNGVAVAGWIHSALVVGEASAWLWFAYKLASDDNESLVLTGDTLTKRAYTLGNYSKFVRPGYIMVDVSGNSNADLLLSAFHGPDGNVVVVAINKGLSDASLPITIAGGTPPDSCTPNVTASDADLEAGSSITLTGGTFTANLAGQSVTTFVCHRQ